MSAAVRLDLHADGRVTFDAPAGWFSPARRAALAAAVDRVRPDLARAAAAPLAPRAQWSEAMLDLWREREAVGLFDAGLDAEAAASLADAELAVAVARGEVPDA